MLRISTYPNNPIFKFSSCSCSWSSLIYYFLSFIFYFSSMVLHILCSQTSMFHILSQYSFLVHLSLRLLSRPVFLDPSRFLLAYTTESSLGPSQLIGHVSCEGLPFSRLTAGEMKLLLVMNQYTLVINHFH